MLPVFGGISGCTSTTCSDGAASSAANGVIAARQLKHERARTRAADVLGDLVVRRAQETRRLSVLFHATIEHVVGTDPQRVRVEALAAAIIELQRDAAVRSQLRAGDDIRS